MSEKRKREMEFRKSMYFHIFSESIQFQLGKTYDNTLVDQQTIVYSEDLKNENSQNFWLNSKNIFESIKSNFL